MSPYESLPYPVQTGGSIARAVSLPPILPYETRKSSQRRLSMARLRREISLPYSDLLAC